MRRLLCIAFILLGAGCGDKKQPQAPADNTSKPAARQPPGQAPLPGPFALKRSIEQDLRRQNKKAQERKALMDQLTRHK